MSGGSRCGSRHHDGTEIRRCSLERAHDGMHRRGDLVWINAGAPARARVGGQEAPPGKLSALDVAKVAAEACVDPRSVVRALEGRTKSHVVRVAIVAALRKLDFKREAAALEKVGA